MFLIWRENLLSCDNMRLRRSKDVIFQEKNIQKILFDLFRKWSVSLLIIN